MNSPTIARCRICGQVGEPTDRFCGYCGSPVATDAGQPTAAEHSPSVDRILDALRSATLGEYDIAGELGRGGMAVVFLAHELQLNRKVAIKVLLPELLYTDGMDRRFKQEARVAAKLDHPNILVIYGVRESKDLLFIVTKLVDGRPLSGVLRRGGQIPLPVAQFIIRQIADALNYAHAEGVVHRDVKPANVMVDRKGNLVVMDFGIAKAVDDANLTRTGLVIGTPAYMSPEQCLSQRVTYAADQYSLGTVAYELLTGVTPFRGSALEMQWAHVKDAPEPVRVLRPDCPPALEALVMRMLAKSPDDRWGSLQDVVDALTLDPAAEVAARQHLASIVAGKPGAPLQSLPVTPVSPIPRTPLATEIVPAPTPPPAAPVPPPPPPPTISLTPRQIELEEGESADVALTIDPPDGNGARPVWTTTNSSVAQVSDAGTVTAVTAGVAGVVVTLGGVAARCSVHVDAPRAHSVEIDPPEATLTAGSSRSFSVRATSRTGRPVSSRPKIITTDRRVARVDADGLMTAREPGRTEVVATVDGVETRAYVVVVPVRVASLRVDPQEIRLAPRKKVRVSAEPLDASGNVLPGRQVTWSSKDATIAVVKSGAVHSLEPGGTVIEATCDGMTVSVPVRVDAPPPPPPKPVRDETATPVHRNGIRSAVMFGVPVAALAIAGLVWQQMGQSPESVAAPGSPAQQEPPGPIAAPPARPVTPTVDQKGDSITTVAPAPKAPDARQPDAPTPPVRRVVSIDLALPPGLDRLEPGDSLRIVARPIDGDRRSMATRLTWRSSASQVVGVSTAGWVKARAPGDATIEIRTDSLSRSVPVRVLSPRVARVVIAGAPDRVTVGDPTRLQVSALGKNGSAIAGADLTWRSLAPEIASVDGDGRVNARAAGRAAIIASASGVADTVALTIEARPEPVRPTVTTPPVPKADPPTVAAAAPPALTRETAEGLFRDFIAAMSSRAFDRVNAVYPEGGTADDVRLHREFVKFLRDATPQVALRGVGINPAGPSDAFLAATVRFSWRNNAGIPYNRETTFIAPATYVDGRWVLRNAKLTAKFW